MTNTSISSILQWLINHYRLPLILVFVVIMVFFGNFSLINQIKIQRELHQLERDVANYKHEIERYRQQLREVLNNPAETERFAREVYLMQRPGEKVFLIDR